MSTEQSPLLANQPQDDNDSGVVKSPKATPLPALQLFCANFTQFCEPVTATVIFPFIVQLVRRRIHFGHQRYDITLVTYAGSRHWYYSRERSQNRLLRGMHRE